MGNIDVLRFHLKTKTHLEIQIPEVQLDCGDFTYLNIFVVGYDIPPSWSNFTSLFLHLKKTIPYPRRQPQHHGIFFLRTLPMPPPSGKQDFNQDSLIINLLPFMTLEYSWGSGASFHVVQQCRCFWEYPPRINISKKGPFQNDEKTSNQHFFRGYTSFRGSKSLNKTDVFCWRREIMSNS